MIFHIDISRFALYVYTSTFIFFLHLFTSLGITSFSTLQPRSDSYVTEILPHLFSGPLATLVVLNMSFCCLLLLGRLILWSLFGGITITMESVVTRSIVTYFFSKLLVAIVVHPTVFQLVGLGLAFLVFPFLLAVVTISNSHFEQMVAQSAATSPSQPSFSRLLVASSFVACGAVCLLVFILGLWFSSRLLSSEIWLLPLFLIFQCIGLFVHSSQTVGKLCLHAYDIKKYSGLWEKRNLAEFFVEFSADMMQDFLTLVESCLMFWHGGMGISLFMLLQLRRVWSSLRQRIHRFHNFRYLLSSIDSLASVVEGDELEQYDDVCAVCVEGMHERALRLSCGHVFHKVCLMRWLERRGSCPTCRTMLHLPNHPTEQDQGGQDFVLGGGFRWLNWLPRVTFRHVRAVPTPHNELRVTFHQRVEQIREVFPDIPPFAIAADLARSGSVEMTLENILSGRLAIENPQPPDASVLLPSTSDVPTSSVPSTPSSVDFSQVSSPESVSEPGSPQSDSPSSSLSTEDTNESSSQTFSLPRFSAEFPNSSHERHESLIQRRAEMLAESKRRYRDRLSSSLTPPKTASVSRVNTVSSGVGVSYSPSQVDKDSPPVFSSIEAEPEPSPSRHEPEPSAVDRRAIILAAVDRRLSSDCLSGSPDSSKN